MTSPWRPLRAAAAAACLVLLAAGCSSHASHSAAGGTPSPASSAIHGSSDAVALFREAQSNLAKVHSVYVVGQTNQSDEGFSVAVQFINGVGASGTISASGEGTFSIVALGNTFYFKIDQAG